MNTSNIAPIALVLCIVLASACAVTPTVEGGKDGQSLVACSDENGQPMYDEYGNVMMCEGEPIATANQQGEQLMYDVKGGEMSDDQIRRWARSTVTWNTCMSDVGIAGRTSKGILSIEEAYRRLLRREPDAGGLAYYSQVPMPECSMPTVRDSGKLWGVYFYGSVEECELRRRVENTKNSILISNEIATMCAHIENID